MSRWDGQRLRLRAGVSLFRLSPQVFVLQEPGEGSTYELGAQERYLLHLLQSRDWPDTSSLLDAYASRMKRPLSERNVLEFVEQLSRRGLLADPDGDASDADGIAPLVAGDPRREAPVSEPTSGVRSDSKASLNLFFDLLLVFFGWILHPICVIPILILAWMAANLVIRHSDEVFRVLAKQREMTRAGFVVFLILLQVHRFCLIDLPRAFMIGMAARRFGGRIEAIEVRFWKGFIPFVHVDIGDSPALMKEEGRYTLLAVSPWTMLAIGSVGTILWWINRRTSQEELWFWLLPPSVIGLTLSGLIFIDWSAAHLLICNYFDDWRLHDRAVAETRAWLSGRISPEPLTGNERYWLRRYGVGFFCFRVLADPAFIGLVALILVYRLQGIGAIFSVLFLFFWCKDYFRGQGRGRG